MTNLSDTLAALSEAATQGTWGIWFEQINGKADAAIQELIDQVHHTDPIGQSLVMLDADGKCPAITGCGPTSAANAAFIVALVNAYRTGQLVPVPSVERVAAVKENLTGEQLDKPVKLEVVQWEGRLHCAYMNDFRVAGGKPWGGGQTAKKWTTSLREIIRAFPELQQALGLDYLGKRATAVIAAMQEGRCD